MLPPPPPQRCVFANILLESFDGQSWTLLYKFSSWRLTYRADLPAKDSLSTNGCIAAFSAELHNFHVALLASCKEKEGTV